MHGDDCHNSGTINRQDFNDRVMEVNSLKTELERVRKDKNITSGLVTQMQRDMANKVMLYLMFIIFRGKSYKKNPQHPQ